ncbi:MAG: pyridoxal-phosphate dependent enzyme, partial [Solirubrobacteraceae bacterium]
MIDWALEADLERSHAAAVRTRARICGLVRRTPLAIALDGPVTRLLKLETLQRSGSFKVRGAAAAITAAERPREIVAASTGNHALAVATIARELGIPCRIYVPSGVQPVKLERLEAAGIEPHPVEGDPLAAELAAREVAARSPGALLVPPYNDPEVVLGQAGIGLELLDEVSEPPDALFAAVGGGGLIGGLAIALRARWPSCAIVGCVPAASPAMRDAVAAGEVVDSPVTPTLADATAGNIEPGSITVALCSAFVDQWLVIEEDEIAAAMRGALLDLHLVVEGAAALALAGSLRHPAGGRHVVVLS